MTIEKNIYQRLNAVRQEVEYLKKEKKVESYMAVTHDQVTREVRKWFVAHGIAIVPYLIEQKTVDTGTKTKSGTPIVRFESVFDVTFVSVDDPQSYVTSRVAAHANDQGDKAPGKALSYAVKSAILKVLMIETGESDESRSIDEVSAQTIVDLEAAMDEAATKDDLAVALREAIAEAKQCGDRYAAKRFRAYAEKTAAKKFNEFMPTSTTQAEPPPSSDVQPESTASNKEPTQERSPEPQAERAAPNKEVKLATAGMMTTVKKAMERTQKTEEQLFEKFKFGSSAIPAERINEVISWARS